MSWRSYQYETNPLKFVDPKAGAVTRIGQTLGGLVRGAAGALGNATLGDENGRIWEDSDPAGTFAKNNLRRYQSPTSIIPPAPVAAPARPTPQMKPSHTPGERLIGSRSATLAATTPAAPPTVARLSRRVAPVPSAPAVTSQAAPAAPTELAPVDLGYMEQDGVRLYIPGSKSFESGVGVTESQPAAPAATTRLRAGDLGYAGSQQEWEDNQAMAGLRTPMGLQVAAELRASRAQGETELNNLRTYGVNQQNADSTALNTMSQVQERDTLRPWKVKEQVSNLLTADATRAETAEKTAGQRLVNRFYPESIRADINYKNNLGQSVLDKTNTDMALAVQELKNQAKLAEIQSKAGNPLREAEAVYLTNLSQQSGLPPSQVAKAVDAGFPRFQKGKDNIWPWPDKEEGFVNDQGRLYRPGQAALPAGYTHSGKFTPDGRPIIVDANGKKFVQ